MGRVLTDSISLSYCKEIGLGDPGIEWNLTEIDAINNFGAEITTVVREPISKNRQRSKGIVSDLGSTVGFDTDLTCSSFRDFISGFCFVRGINSDVTQIPSSGAIDITNHYIVNPLTAGQADKMDDDTLLWVTGGIVYANNGLKSVSIDIITGATEITVKETLVTETDKFDISFAGKREDSGANLSWEWSSILKNATLTGIDVGVRLASMGLVKGAEIHIGSIDNKGDTVIKNAFENVQADDIYGYARCLDISDDVVIFDKVDLTLQYTNSTPPTTDIDILFGEFFRNVSVDHDDFVQQSYQFELEFPNLGAGGTDEYQYSIGNLCDSLAIKLPETDKATITYGFIGTDTENPTSLRKPGADTPIQPNMREAFSTSTDIVKLRIAEIDDNGISTDFKDVNITLNNNVSPEKVLGTLGAKFMNAGIFNIDIETRLIFTDSAVINKIRNNETITIDFIIKNGDGVIIFDLPEATLGGGLRDFPRNESVLINVKSQPYGSSNFGTSIGISVFPVPLP